MGYMCDSLNNDQMIHPGTEMCMHIMIPYGLIIRQSKGAQWKVRSVSGTDDLRK